MKRFAIQTLKSACVMAGLALATIATSAPARAELSLFKFDVGQISVFQGSGNAFSGFASWTPTLGLGSFALKLDAGASLLTDGTNKFVAGRGQLLASLNMGSTWDFEVGPGAQMWMEEAKNTMIIFGGANLRYKMGSFLQPFAGYSALLIPGALTHEIRIGTGVTF